MYIHEAIAATNEHYPYITRAAWYGGSEEDPVVITQILPTDGPDGMIIDGMCQRKPSRGWQPRKQDLIADDWCVCAETNFRFQPWR